MLTVIIGRPVAVVQAVGIVVRVVTARSRGGCLSLVVLVIVCIATVGAAVVVSVVAAAVVEMLVLMALVVVGAMNRAVTSLTTMTIILTNNAGSRGGKVRLLLVLLLLLSTLIVTPHGRHIHALGRAPVKVTAPRVHYRAAGRDDGYLEEPGVSIGALIAVNGSGCLSWHHVGWIRFPPVIALRSTIVTRLRLLLYLLFIVVTDPEIKHLGLLFFNSNILCQNSSMRMDKVVSV